MTAEYFPLKEDVILQNEASTDFYVFVTGALVSCILKKDTVCLMANATLATTTNTSSNGSGSAWKAYMNARVAGLFLLVLLEYPNRKGVVRAMSRDSIWHYTGRELELLLMSPRQDKTSEPLLYAGRMTGPYRVEDATGGRNDDPVTMSSSSPFI
ncbi:protein FEZ [Tanacetum coccineum]